MPFVSKTPDGGEDATLASSGARRWTGLDFDPADPDVVKVHYDLVAWSVDATTELSQTLAELGIPHVWEGSELVGPEDLEDDLDRILDTVEARYGPFPLPLDPEASVVEYGLDGWPTSDLTIMKESLIEAEIPHRWSGSRVEIEAEHESLVDDLLDAVEAGEVASFDRSAPEGVLNDLYAAVAQLARDPASSRARTDLDRLISSLTPELPPFGMAIRPWATLLDMVAHLLDDLADGGEPHELSRRAGAIRDEIRNWV